MLSTLQDARQEVSERGSVAAKQRGSDASHHSVPGRQRQVATDRCESGTEATAPL